MANRPSDPNTGTPRWVKLFGIMLIAVILLLLILLITGGGLGEHGPGRHISQSYAPLVVLAMVQP